MLILAIDTTAIAATAAVCRIEEGIFKDYSHFTLKNGLKHSERLLPIIDAVLKMYGAGIADIDLAAVSAGPGSFTGVRIGAATVKGLVFSRDIPVAPVSALEALARSCKGFDGIVCPVMDARREQFYNALFINCKRLTPDRCISAEELYTEIKDKKTIVCGDGAALFKSFYDDEDIILAPEAAREQNALSVALCGYDAYINQKTVSGSELKPVYLRPSQAERERNRKEGIQ